MMNMSVLLATDGSPEALAAAEWLDRWGDPESTRVTVATVIVPPSMTWAAGATGYVLETDLYQKSYQEIVDEERATAERVLANTHRQLTRMQTDADEILLGQPARTLVDYAKKHHMDLIVMGRRGHSALGNLMGSVSFAVVQRSSVPVTIVS